MASFKGQAEYSVDSKGRVAIPAKMRSAMTPDAEGTFVITRGFETCVFLYPKDRWEQIEEEIGQLNMFQREAREFARRILMWAEDSSLDKQGRVSLPKSLMEYAGINDRALIIGAFDHIEIWDQDVWERHMNESADDYETLAERVMA